MVSETFLRAWSALPRYRDTGAPFVAWLYGIARHVIADVRKSQRRVEPREQVPERLQESAPDDGLALQTAIRNLPKEQRQIIEMKFLLGLTNPEVAAILKKSIGAVNAQQWRALRAMRPWMESQ